MSSERKGCPGFQLKKKNLFQTKMPEVREKCKYFYSGYYKYQDKCRVLHPKEEFDQKCKLKNCMKRHIKPCRYGTNCRQEKCAFKHTKDINTKLNIDEIVSLRKTLKVLLDYKTNSEARIKNLEEEIKSVNPKKEKIC